MSGRLLALALVLAAALGGFAIYTFGYRESDGPSRPTREERARVARIIGENLREDFSGYIARIERYSPGQYLVTVGDPEHLQVVGGRQATVARYAGVLPGVAQLSTTHT